MDEIKLIASDMDHTLLTENGDLPPNIEATIAKLTELDINFAIASGRPLYTLNDVFQKTSDQMIFIADNGAAIAYKGEVIFKSLLETATYQAIIRFIVAETDGIPILCGLDSAVISRTDARHIPFLQTFYSKIKTVDNLADSTLAADKLTIYFPKKNSQIFYEKLFKPRFAKTLSVTVGDTIWIDLMNLGIDKGKAITFLARYLGIATSQMMAFGDTYNDVEMLQAVKYSYLVANASSDMQQYATFTTASNDDNGVMKIIEKVIKATEKRG
ncbi:haloacid dehalogenase [Lactococcus hodotermopsidis]|uniref:Haloacid dehalogenase n=1 Tax=Pseudolactococcus hodotermopsidis TaxID=2709157 RepID=A0A6A0BCG7_9LACT|nr:HAD family hydrolase [Lactococcus hodotermopsidis]GFH43062.1 haloacid dehalogenase [Lactococcus hodotermopsidis]